MQAPVETSPRAVTARRSVRRVPSQTLFTRWLLLVYCPLGLLGAGFSLFVLGGLPGWMKPLLLLLAIWGVAATRLLWERQKLGIQVPPPRDLVLALAALTFTALMGTMLIWLGLDRLSSTSGVVMLYFGGVLVLTAVLAPIFKALDMAIRTVARRVLREPRASG